MKQMPEIYMHDEDNERFCNAKCCVLFCKTYFNKKDIKVRYHDHRTGQFRGVAHQACNIKFFNNRYLPICVMILRDMLAIS